MAGRGMGGRTAGNIGSGGGLMVDVKVLLLIVILNLQLIS